MATVFSGGTYVNFQTFLGNFKCLIMQNIMSNLITAGWTKQNMDVGKNPGSYGLATQGPGNAATVTFTTGTPGIINWTGHGFLGGEKIMFQAGTGGTLPTGVAVNTIYYVKYINTTTFNVASSYNGSNIALSGSPAGTTYCYSHYILMVSGTQSNVTNPTVIRIQDNAVGGAATSTVAITVQNYTGTFFAGNGMSDGTGNGRYYGAHLLPVGSPNYQITATKYWFYVSQVGALTYRDFAFAGMLYVPSFLSGVVDHGFVLANTWDGENTNQLPNSFRTTTNIAVSWVANTQCMWNNTTSEAANNNGAFIGLANPLIMKNLNWYTSLMSYRWANDDVNASDVLLAFGSSSIGWSSYNTEGKIRGQFYDMIYIADAFAIDATDTFNGHTWLNMTNNATGVPRGGMWVATS